MEEIKKFVDLEELLKIAEQQGHVTIDDILSASAYSYEDIGFTPAEMAELAQAKKDGRLTVPPCKKGDVLWTYYILRDCDLNGVLSGRVVSVSIVDGHIKFKLGYRECYTEFCEEDIGKTVFLTREEAEAALEARKGEKK